MDFPGLNNSLDIILIGRTGDGKSETANTILGRNIFPTSANSGSETIAAQYDWCHFEDNDIKVVDCPGLGDTRLGVKDDVQQFIDAVKMAIAYNPKGYHAFLYVLKFGNRFQKEDDLNVFTLKSLLGNNFLKDHGILVMTYGDSFVTEPTVKKYGYCFEEWLKKQDKFHKFQNLLKECSDRAVLFDNRTDDTEKKMAQVRKLVEIIRLLSDDGKRYTNEEFEKVEKKRKELLEILGKEQEKTEVLDKIGPIISKIKNATDNEEGSDELLKISQEIDKLDVFVKKASISNTKLNSLQNIITNYLRVALQAKKNEVANIIAYTNLMKEKRITYDKVLFQFKNRRATEFTEKEENKREEELQIIEKEICKIEDQFKKSRRKDLPETKLRIDECESKYICEKNVHRDPFISRLLDFMKNLFPIGKLFDRISKAFK